MDSPTLTLLSAASALTDEQVTQLADLTVTELRDAAAALVMPDSGPAQSQSSRSQSPADMNSQIRAAAGR